MDNIFLEGTLVNLKPLTKDDITDKYINWLNDEKVCAFNSHHRFPNTGERTLSYVESVNNSSNSLVLSIWDKKKNTHIGNVSIQNINYIDSKAEFAILIGELDDHSKGVGYDASKLIINHAFNSLNLHRIYCGTSSKNIGMQKLAKKIGMKEEGTLEDGLFKDGKYESVILYGLLSNHHQNNN